MRAGALGRVTGAFGAVGVTTIAVDDCLRFSFGGVLVGGVPVALAALSFVLLLFGAFCSWRPCRAFTHVFGALALQLVGRAVVNSEPAGVFWVVSAVHAIAPVAAVIVAAVLSRSAEQRAVRWAARVSVIAGVSWFIASATPLPLLLVPVSRSIVDVCLLVVIAWPVLLRVGRLAWRLWDSADVR